ncbi:MAG: alpha/beta hydrolase [Polyangiales bacterium]
MSVQLFLADKLLRLTLKRMFSRQGDIMQLRRFMDEAARRRPIRAPSHVTVSATELGGVRTEALSTPQANTSRAFLYLHGGGWVAGSPATHRGLTWRLAHGMGAPVYAPDYRLAPEHPFPAALDDCLAAYRALVRSGIAPHRIAVGGDSAGGHLSLALALVLKQEGLPQPGALVCLSPATTLADAFDSHTANLPTDAMFAGDLHGSIVRLYCRDHDRTDPRLSPVRGDVAGLPPTLIHCARNEILRDDSVRMAERMREAGVDVQLTIVPHVFHAWHVMADLLPEARRSVAKIVSFVQKHT